MWEFRRLTTLWASTACYRDSFTFYMPRTRKYPSSSECLNEKHIHFMTVTRYCWAQTRDVTVPTNSPCCMVQYRPTAGWTRRKFSGMCNMDTKVHDATHTNQRRRGGYGNCKSWMERDKKGRRCCFTLRYYTRIILQVPKLIRDREWWTDICQHGRSTNWQHGTTATPG
jgi:hypothetical protein